MRKYESIESKCEWCGKSLPNMLNTDIPEMLFQVINLKESKNYNLKPFWLCPECFLKIPIKEFENGHYALHFKYIPAPVQGRKIQTVNKLEKDFTVIEETRAEGTTIITETRVVDDSGNLKPVLKPAYNTAKVIGFTAIPSEETYHSVRALLNKERKNREELSRKPVKSEGREENQNKKVKNQTIKERITKTIYGAFPNLPRKRK